jgi:phosphoribosylaminoimidazole-succinocarboxamide synthase (EC 6.3.2.6)
MQFGPILTEGKTKIVYTHPTDPDLVILQHKDGITAGDGLRRSVIAGKGALAGRTTANVFMLLNRAGIATHFVAAPEPALTIARRCTMIPLEVVQRRLATGSYLKRHPELAEGTRFAPPLVEFFLKDDTRHDPLITPEQIIAQGIATEAEVQQMQDIGLRVFVLLEQAWNRLDVTLVDLKIEFGRAVNTTADTPSTPPALLVADVIDNDSWRIWPGGEKSRMLDKQIYRNAAQVDAALLEDIYQRYRRVADLTDTFQKEAL